MKTKMKWIRILSLLLCCVCLFSCETQTGEIQGDDQTETEEQEETQEVKDPLDAYAVYCIDASDSVGNSALLNWHSFRGDRPYKYQSEEAEEQMKVQMFGKLLKGTYDSSWTAGTLRGEEIRIYKIEEGFRPRTTFGVDPESGKVVRYSLGGDTVSSAEQTEASVAAANAYAKEILGEENFENYELFCDQSSLGVVYYRYYRVINGHKSAEYLAMRLTEDYQLKGYTLENFGMFDGINSFEFDEAKAVAAIEAELSEIYGGELTGFYQNFEYLGYEIRDVSPVILPNGQKAYTYSVSSILQREESDGGVSIGGEAFEFVIPAEVQ